MVPLLASTAPSTAAAPPRPAVDPVLRVRWLGRVEFADAHAVQSALWARSSDDHLLLLEHTHTVSLGVRGRQEHVLDDVEAAGAAVVRTNRGGDVTYHGPGQLVGYPIRAVPGHRGGGMADTAAYVADVEELLIGVLARFGLTGASRVAGRPGVWLGGLDGDDSGAGPLRKIAAIGVRLGRGRSMHGFALNVDPDLAWFDRIVPCGIPDAAVTSLAAEGIEVSMREVVDEVACAAVSRWAPGGRWERADAAWRQRPEDLAAFSRGLAPPDLVASAAARAGRGTTQRESVAAVAAPSLRLRGRLAEAGVADGLAVRERKPEWLRAPVVHGPEVAALKRTLRGLELVTVCEEAGCPNLSDCWADGTATFMINGERCTRACGFCLVDTRKPEPLDPAEPSRVAEAVVRLGLDFAVVTAVARDDLPDGGAAAFAATVAAIRARRPGVRVEVLIPDCRGEEDALDVIFAVRPDVVNHNIETVLRLQRAVRPSASYTRSLAVLARAKAAGCTTKSGLVVGMGETDDEVVATLADLAAVGVDIVTIGQYLRPTAYHLPVARWVPPPTFDAWAGMGRALGLAHVEASPLTRSSYHARAAADAAPTP